MAFIYNPIQRAGLSSCDMDDMIGKDDGSVTLYFGPHAPDGLEAQLDTHRRKRPLPVVRFYGPTETFWKRDWKLGDLRQAE